MSYRYEDLKASIFSEQGQRMFLSIRDQVRRHLRESGAVMMEHAISGQTGGSWEMLACVDRMVELGELWELEFPNGTPAGQHRVFVSGGFGPQTR